MGSYDVSLVMFIEKLFDFNRLFFPLMLSTSFCELCFVLISYSRAQLTPPRVFGFPARLFSCIALFTSHFILVPGLDAARQTDLLSQNAQLLAGLSLSAPALAPTPAALPPVPAPAPTQAPAPAPAPTQMLQPAPAPASVSRLQVILWYARNSAPP